jgi:hypothetical protein
MTILPFLSILFILRDYTGKTALLQGGIQIPERFRSRRLKNSASAVEKHTQKV